VSETASSLVPEAEIPEVKKHCLHLYTGNGKGKTTACVGLTIRAVGAGHRVAFCQFDKGFEGTNEHYHERFILRRLPEVDLFFFGMERMMPDGKFRFANIPEDFEQAKRGLDQARKIIAEGKHDLVVLDEAITSVMTKLLTEQDLLDLVADFRRIGKCDLVLSGRGAFPQLIESADLVSDVTLVKHYFYEGVEARKGIEY
jgi:cob(I)alamin adenosyltransferase